MEGFRGSPSKGPQKDPPNFIDKILKKPIIYRETRPKSARQKHYWQNLFKKGLFCPPPNSRAGNLKLIEKTRSKSRRILVTISIKHEKVQKPRVRQAEGPFLKRAFFYEFALNFEAFWGGFLIDWKGSPR